MLETGETNEGADEDEMEPLALLELADAEGEGASATAAERIAGRLMSLRHQYLVDGVEDLLRGAPPLKPSAAGSTQGRAMMPTPAGTDMPKPALLLQTGAKVKAEAQQQTREQERELDGDWAILKQLESSMPYPSHLGFGSGSPMRPTGAPALSRSSQWINTLGMHPAAPKTGRNQVLAAAVPHGDAQHSVFEASEGMPSPGSPQQGPSQQPGGRALDMQVPLGSHGFSAAAPIGQGDMQVPMRQGLGQAPIGQGQMPMRRFQSTGVSIISQPQQQQQQQQIGQWDPTLGQGNMMAGAVRSAQWPAAQYGVNAQTVNAQIANAQMMRMQMQMLMGGGGNQNANAMAGGMGMGLGMGAAPTPYMGAAPPSPYMATAPRFAAQAVQHRHSSAPGGPAGNQWMQTPLAASLAGLPTVADALDDAWSNMAEAAKTGIATREAHKHKKPETEETVGTDAARYMQEMDFALDTVPKKHVVPSQPKASTVGHRRHAMPPTPHGAGDLWKETAKMIEEHDIVKASSASQARFKTAAGISTTVSRTDELAAFYQKYSPSHVTEAASILGRYSGHEDLLWARLKSKYGEVPTRERVLEQRQALARTQTPVAEETEDDDEALRKGYDSPGMSIVMNAALHEELTRSAEVDRRISAMKAAMT